MSDLLHIPVAFRVGTRLPSTIDDPQQVHAAIAAVFAHTDEAQAADIVAAASDPRSPIHDAFIWDDAVASEKFREGQAFYLAAVLVDTRTGQRVYTSQYRETNNPADAGRIRINVQVLPPQPPEALPMVFTVRTAPPALDRAALPVEASPAPAQAAMVYPDSDDERALAVFTRWVAAHRHHPDVLRAALRILYETL